MQNPKLTGKENRITKTENAKGKMQGAKCKIKKT
jgi:hypothetical protein